MAKNCIFCDQNGYTVTATHSAPQDNGDGTWEWVEICTSHAEDWWDGSDYPRGSGAPPITPLRSQQAIETTRKAQL